KFFYPIVAAGKDAPAPESVEGRRGITYRRWRPIGTDTAVTMDTHDPYVGKQSASVLVEGAAPRGLGQGGIGVIKGKTYTGHVVLSGDASARVQVMLAWGSGPGDRQTVSLPQPGSNWQSVPFELTAGADSSDA